MHYSKHAKKRLQQRAISRADAEFVLEYGRVSRAPGGVESIVMPQKELRARIESLRQEAERLRRIGKIGLITAGEVVITVKHCY